MSDRYGKLFDRLAKNSEGAFIPFVMLGDPGMRESEAVIEALIEGGADALELGVPFSDPTADVPAVQTAANRALEKGAGTFGCLEVLASVRKKHEDIPIGLRIYANLAVGAGAEEFYRRAAESGADSVLALDVPVISSRPFTGYARDAGILQTFIAPSNAGEAQLKEIAAAAKGFVYFSCSAGPAGKDGGMELLAQKIKVLKDAGAPPVVAAFGGACPGFGPALAAGADGVIEESAVAEIVAKNLGDAEKTRAGLIKFARGVKIREPEKN